jgi:hypothetical protein
MSQEPMELAKAFKGKCAREIEFGGNYRERLLLSDSFRKLSLLFDKPALIIEKAEMEADKERFFRREFTGLYKEWRELHGRNFEKAPLVKSADIQGSFDEISSSVRAMFPEMCALVEQWELNKWFRFAVIQGDRELLAEWEQAWGPVRRVPPKALTDEAELLC